MENTAALSAAPSYIAETPLELTLGVYRHTFTCRNHQCLHRCRLSLVSRKNPCSVSVVTLDALFSSLCNSLELEEAAHKKPLAGQKTLTSLVGDENGTL
jgi:hypothetical protein